MTDNPSALLGRCVRHVRQVKFGIQLLRNATVSAHFRLSFALDMLQCYCCVLHALRCWPGLGVASTSSHSSLTSSTVLIEWGLLDSVDSGVFADYAATLLCV